MRVRMAIAADSVKLMCLLREAVLTFTTARLVFVRMSFSSVATLFAGREWDI